MTMPEIILVLGGGLAATIGLFRLAFCKIARHTARLLQLGWKDHWL